MNAATYQMLIRALGFRDEMILEGLKRSGYLSEGRNLPLKTIEIWRQGKENIGPNKSRGRRPFPEVSLYMQEWIERVIEHEDRLVEQADDTYAATGEPVTIHVPRSDRGITHGGALSEQWADYVGFVPVAKGVASRALMRLVAMGVPARLDYIESALARIDYYDGQVPEWRDDELDVPAGAPGI